MRQIKLLADERNAEALSDLLMDAGALCAVIEDADAESTDEKPLYGEPGLEPENCAWPRSILSALSAAKTVRHSEHCKRDGVDESGTFQSAPQAGQR